MKAIWKDTVIAESSNTTIVEGNHYFPREDVKMEYFTETELKTTCPWKGEASYYTVTVEGEANENAAWTYREPKPAAREIKDHIAFYGSVQVVE